MHWKWFDLETHLAFVATFSWRRPINTSTFWCACRFNLILLGRLPYMYMYHSVLGKCPWVLKHISWCRPSWVLTRDIHMFVYKLLHWPLRVLKCGTWALTREWALAWDMHGCKDLAQVRTRARSLLPCMCAYPGVDALYSCQQNKYLNTHWGVVGLLWFLHIRKISPISPPALIDKIFIILIFCPVCVKLHRRYGDLYHIGENFFHNFICSTHIIWYSFIFAESSKKFTKSPDYKKTKKKKNVLKYMTLSHDNTVTLIIYRYSVWHAGGHFSLQ